MKLGDIYINQDGFEQIDFMDDCAAPVVIAQTGKFKAPAGPGRRCLWIGTEMRLNIDQLKALHRVIGNYIVNGTLADIEKFICNTKK